VDLESVVDDAWAGVEVPVREDLEVIVGQLPVVGGDPVQLRTLFTNLFENAIRYSDQAPRIETEAEAEGGRWRISVEDEGVGIPQAHHERVLDPFERLEPVSEGGGAGLGLAICQRIVDRHDGELEVASTPGEGSTFSFTLPPAPMEAPSEAELGPERGSLVL
jgi:signal transduction histidine kinase